MGVYQLSVAPGLQARFDEAGGFEPGSEEEELYLDGLHSENAANARLIACAPEMLEALEACLHLAETPGDFTAAERLAVLHDSGALIARAKGVE